MIKIINPKAAKRVAAISSNRFNAIMEEGRSKQYLSFDDIRAAEKKTAKQLPDGAIHQAAIDAGLEIEVAPTVARYSSALKQGGAK